MTDIEALDIERKAAISSAQAWQKTAEDRQAEILTKAAYIKQILNQLAEWKQIVMHLVLTWPGYKPGDCFTLPDGDCIGIGCMHTPMETTSAVDPDDDLDMWEV